MAFPLYGLGGRLFNPSPRVEELRFGAQRCWVVDDALLHPERVVDWASEHEFEPTDANAYPGLLTAVPAEWAQALDGFFMQHVRAAMGGRRTLEMHARLSLVTLPDAALRPGQWLCHRDRVPLDPRQTLVAASVLYLFRDARLGGTSFYEPRCSAAELQQLIDDSQALDAQQFAARYGVSAGYMRGSNRFFEQIGHVPAAWNRLIFYDGGMFHSAQIDHPELLSGNVRQGRLTLNGFFACRRAAIG